MNITSLYAKCTLVLSLIALICVSHHLVHSQGTEIEIHHNQLGQAIQRLEAQSLQAQGWAYYLLNNKEGDNLLPIASGQSIYFLVTPLSGDVDLYVSLYGKPAVDDKGHCSTCLRQSTSAHGDFVFIARDDDAWPTQQEFAFHIGVRTTDVKSSFTLTVWITDNGEAHPGTTIELEDGLPQVAKIVAGHYTYFRFKISDDTKTEIANLAHPNDFTIAITPVSGDPDIFVSTDAGTTRPHQGGQNVWWHSADFGADVVPIKATDEHYTRDGYYYIGIYSWSLSGDTLFTLTATSNKRYAHVIESVGYIDVVDQSMFKYYKFYMTEDKKQRILFTVSPIGARGDPDLFVAPALEVTPENPPSATNCHNGQWCRQRAGEDSVTIEKEDAVHGYFYVAVKGWVMTKYQMIASTERNSILLQDAFAVSMPIPAHEFVYFKYYHTDSVAGISFQATGLPGSSVHMFLSDVSKNTHPNFEKHDHVGMTQGNIAHFNYWPPVAVGMYYIGVVSTVHTNLSMIAFTNHTLIPLVDGQVLVMNTVPENGHRYYYFDAAIDATRKITGDVVISVSPMQGDVDIYASTQFDRPSRHRCENSPDKCWISTQWRQDGIAISPDDTKLGGHTRIYIAVYGKQPFNWYSIVASMTANVRQLSDGTTSPGVVVNQKYAYYSFEIPNSADITVQMDLDDPQSTDADIYMAQHYKPDKVYCEHETACYKSEKLGNDIIHITEAPAGMWYISVFGVSARQEGDPIAFTIKASEKYHYIWPNHDAFIYESTPAGKVQQIRTTYISSTANFVVVSATLISGRTRLYVNGNYTHADKYNHKWMDNNWPGNTLLIRRTEENKDLFGRPWHIGVEAVEDSDYWVSVSAGNEWWDYAELALSVPRLSVAPVEGPMLFFFNTPIYNWTNLDGPADENYHINIRVLKGGIALFVGQIPFFTPSARNHTFAHVGSNDHLMFLSRHHLKQGRVQISVQAFHEHQDCVFEITVTRGEDPKYLIQDQPQQFFTPTSSYSYFQIWNSKVIHRDLRITAESCTLHPAPQFYVGVNETTQPTREKNSAKSGADDKLKLRQLARISKLPASKYYIGVEGAGSVHGGSMYSIFATTHIDHTRPKLTNGRLKARLMKKHSGGWDYDLTIPRAHAPMRFQDKPLIYDIYRTEVHMKSTNSPIAVNMHTVCGVKHNMFHVGTYEASVGETSDVSFSLTHINSKKVYQVNVIVHDGLGLQTAYDGFWIVRGDIYSDFPNFIQALMVSPGTIIILFALLGFSLYLSIGSIINLLRGQRGWNVIPHCKFWMDLPFLVKDGILFIVTCGRRMTSIKGYEEEDGVESSVNVVNATAGDHDDDRGGYGAI